MVSPQDKIRVNGVEFTHWDIFIVVEDFYRKVAEDPELSIPFKSVHDWPEHIQRLTHFWWIRFGGTPYMFTHYNPVHKHFNAGFNPPLLERWLNLFKETLTERLTPEQTRLWGVIAEKMGDSLSYRNELLKQENQKA